jgi:hypothetical protein
MLSAQHCQPGVIYARVRKLAQLVNRANKLNKVQSSEKTLLWQVFTSYCGHTSLAYKAGKRFPRNRFHNKIKDFWKRVHLCHHVGSPTISRAGAFGVTATGVA